MISPVVQPEVAREQIRPLLDRINDAWLKLAPEDIPAALDDCFDDQAVIKGPDLTVLANGKQACIGATRTFFSKLQFAIARCPCPTFSCSTTQRLLRIAEQSLRDERSGVPRLRL